MTEVTEESVAECAVCSTDIAPDDAYTTESQEIVCPDCARTCGYCGTCGTQHDDWNIVDNDLWCADCTDNHAYYCESCEEYNRHGTAYVADRDCYWCESCTNNTFFCDDCDNYYEQGYCEDCGDTRVIHDYNYQPDPIFHSTKSDERLFFGIEVEVEAGRNLSDASQYANQLEDMEIAYLKSDGSLNCGFEIVTHPMSHDYYKNEVPELFDTLNHLRENLSVKSWGTGTCGVHVHISRTGFNGGAHMHRFLNLVYSNKDLFSTIAGRESDRWAKFDDVNTGDGQWVGYGADREFVPVRNFRRKLDPRRSHDRYSAVNTNNSNTLELRIFKGSTQAHVIKSYIDLAHASVEYTRTIPVREVANGALRPEPFVEYIIDNEKLYPELVERLNRLYIPTVWLTRQNVSA
jgi:hypothetical protein